MSPPPVALDLPALLSAVETYALASGRVARFGVGDVAGNPGKGATVTVGLSRLAPASGRSGLDRTSARVELAVRVYLPASDVAPGPSESALAGVVDALVAALSADFDLGASGRWVDLLGAHGNPLAVDFGWVKLSDQLYRVATIALPVIIDDLWTQEA